MGEKSGHDNTEMDTSRTKLAFSPRGQAIREKRNAATAGRIQRVLGAKGPISAPFKRAVLDDYDDILERPHLEYELKSFKRILNSLSSSPDGLSSSLLDRLNMDPVARGSSEILCPIWKNSNEVEATTIAASRYIHSRVSDELYLLSIIFDYCENLELVRDKVDEFRAGLDHSIDQMDKLDHGVMMVGAIELDLINYDEATKRRNVLNLISQQGYEQPLDAAWAVTGHFFVRVPRKDVFSKVVREVFPSKGWARVQFKNISRNQSLQSQLMSVLGYAGKYPKPIFDTPTQPKKREPYDKKMNHMAAAFNGPRLNLASKSEVFDVPAAVRQWALCVDDLGADKLIYTVENRIAQKWLSESELAYVRRFDLDVDRQGRNPIELKRDDPLLNNGYLSPVSIHHPPCILKTRRLRFDPDWYNATDCSGMNVDEYFPDFNRLIFSN